MLNYIIQIKGTNTIKLSAFLMYTALPQTDFAKAGEGEQVVTGALYCPENLNFIGLFWK